MAKEVALSVDVFSDFDSLGCTLYSGKLRLFGVSKFSQSRICISVLIKMIILQHRIKVKACLNRKEDF